MKKRKLNKRQKSWIKFIKTNEDWDFMYLLEVERKKIQEIRDCIKRNNRFESNDYCVSRMDLAIRLLDIIIEDSLDFTGYVNDRNIERFFSSAMVNYLRKSIEKGTDDVMGHSCDIRKWAYNDIRKQKAWKLYYKIREFHTRSWWD